MIDVVTVVFREELPILQCQAQSIDLYCKNIGINSIYVMVNESGLSADIDPSWWGSMAYRVRVIPRETFSVNWIGDGWLTQQLLKILGSALSYNAWTMVLDAKTVLTNDISLDLVFNDQGQAKFGWIGVNPVFHPAQEIANRLIDSNNEKILLPAGVPFFFHNASVRSMISYSELKTGNDFASWFLNQGMLTEFVLYSTWISADQKRKELYTDVPSDNSWKICHVCHVQTDQFDRILDSHDDFSHTLSVHRQAWSSLSDKQKQTFRNRLMVRGISKSRLLE